MFAAPLRRMDGKQTESLGIQTTEAFRKRNLAEFKLFAGLAPLHGCCDLAIPVAYLLWIQETSVEAHAQ